VKPFLPAETVLSTDSSLVNLMQNIDFRKLESSETAGKQTEICVGFEVFTAVVMRSIIFWDMTPVLVSYWFAALVHGC
jgi:hypothetical protein